MDLLARNQPLFCSSPLVSKVNHNYSSAVELWPTNQFLFHPLTIVGTGLHSTEFYNYKTFFRSLQYSLRITVFMA